LSNCGGEKGGSHTYDEDVEENCEDGVGHDSTSVRKVIGRLFERMCECQAQMFEGPTTGRMRYRWRQEMSR
jgi:hypothetical protein